MISMTEAAHIASEWYSPRETALVALATARKVPDAHALEQEVIDNINAVYDRPDNFDEPAQCIRELRLLLEFARTYR